MKTKWVAVAEREIGVKEITGGENKRIIEYHSKTSLRATEDEIPWCASFVNWCLWVAGLIGTNSAAAKSFLSWGIKLTEPREGCIVVIRQRVKANDPRTGSSSGYHVGFFMSTVDNRIFILGGNQSDSVKVSSFGLSSYEVIDYRWPEGVK